MTQRPPFPSHGSGDAELDALFAADPDLMETARRVRAVSPEPVPSDVFRRSLRAQLMTAAEARNAPLRRGWLRRSAGTLPALFAGGTGAVLVAATILLVTQSPTTNTAPQAILPLHDIHNVQLSQPITVRFDQPMDQSAVVAGLHIQPATAVSTNWQGNTLVITPLHQLAANTAYTVTIDQAAVRTATGTVAPAPVQFSFGTTATPTPSPTPSQQSGPPVLQPTVLAALGSPAIIGFATDGSPVVDGSLAVAPTSSASPAAGVTPTATPSAPPGVSTPDGTYVLTSSGPARLGPLSTAVAYAPDGAHLVLATSDGSGGSNVVVAATDGSNPTTLADVPQPVISVAWTSAGDIDVVTTSGVTTYAKSGTHRVIASAAADETFTVITSTGRFVAATGSAGSRLVDLSNGSSTPLGGASNVTWSSDGTTVAWTTASGGIDVATPSSFATPTALSAPAGVGAITGLALNRNGTEIALLDSNGTQLLDSTAGSVVATYAAGVTGFAFSPVADTLYLVTTTGGTPGVSAAAVPATAPVSSGVPAAASDAIQTFVNAQAANSSTLSHLAAPGVDVGATPSGLTRAYVIDISNGTAGAVNANARLIIDPSSASKSPRYADEQFSVAPNSDGNYVVSALTVGALTAESAGPHVIHVGTGHDRSVILVTFDSDLDAATVAAAIAVHDKNGHNVPITVAYDATSRTATVTVLSTTHSALTVVVATSLHDISGQQLARAYTVTLG